MADWRVTYDAGGGDYRSYTITLIRDDLKGVRFTEEAVTAASRPGVELVITEPLADFRSLQADDTPQDLAEIFATYLRNYKGVTISVQGVKLDPSALIVGDPAEMNLSDIQDGDNKYPVRLEIVEWKRKTKRVLHLCDDRGFPLLNVDTRWHVGERFFSAYLRSAMIREIRFR